LITNFRRVLNAVCFLLVWFPGFWILYADVSEHSVRSIFIGYTHLPAYEDGTDRVFRNVGM